MGYVSLALTSPLLKLQLCILSRGWSAMELGLHPMSPPPLIWTLTVPSAPLSTCTGWAPTCPWRISAMSSRLSAPQRYAELPHPVRMAPG